MLALSGPFENTIDYAHRANEAYWGYLIITIYFSYWLGKDWYGGIYRGVAHRGAPTRVDNAA